MAEVAGLCSICGGIGEFTCSICGSVVCASHYVKGKKVCTSCSGGRRL